MVSNSTGDQVLVRLKPAQAAALDRVAAARGVTRTALVRQGIGHILAEHDKTKDTPAPK